MSYLTSELLETFKKNGVVVIRNFWSNEEIEERLLKAKEEFSLKNKFDLIIENDDLSDTLKNLKDTVQKFINN